MTAMQSEATNKHTEATLYNRHWQTQRLHNTSHTHTHTRSHTFMQWQQLIERTKDLVQLISRHKTQLVHRIMIRL